MAADETRGMPVRVLLLADRSLQGGGCEPSGTPRRRRWRAPAARRD